MNNSVRKSLHNYDMKILQRFQILARLVLTNKNHKQHYRMFALNTEYWRK
jgi:hypothetical protein